jgi:bacillithiol biosynthesis cysteine-adding enzyme BshC
MPRIKDIPFCDIPHQSNLFLSYLDLSPQALRFYHYPPTMNGLLQAVRGRLAGRQFPRKIMASVLRRQNEMFGSDSKTQRNIDVLEESDSVAVVTGQQVGLFTGPLYTIYKALTAIQVCEQLKTNGIKAVPVFWMDTEDHDLPEVTRRTVLDLDFSIRNIDYQHSLFDRKDVSTRPVGSLQLSQSIQHVVQDFMSRLPDTPWKEEVGSQLESTYRPGASLASSFAQLLTRILSGSGLILFNPQDVEVKRLTSAIFQKALREADAVHAALAQRNLELEAAGFHSQVSVMENSTVLFFMYEGERRALERHHSGFRLKHINRTFSLAELLDCAEQSPEKLSPNVLLRPVIQDHIFPTLAYVGGSSELAYFAQTEVLYSYLGIPMPVLWPRNGYTLIDPAIGSEMDQLGIEFQDCFQGEPLLIEKAIHNSGAPKACVSLDQLKEHLEQGLTKIRPELEAIEPSLARALGTARRKILYNIQHIKSQLIRLEGTGNCSVLSAVRSMLNHCYPNRNLQERELSVLHFLVRHGPHLLNTINSATEIENFSHRVIRLEHTA